MNLAELNQPPVREPTEKAQIVLILNYGQTLVLRFSTIKKAEKEYSRLMEAWRDKSGDLHFVDADMFTSTVQLRYLFAASLVNHKVASAFVPR